MKRPYKITLWILASIVMLLALVLTAVSVILFGSSNLSSIVTSQLNKQDRYEFSLKEADLVLFKTFPELSLHLTDFTMTDRASADTLAAVPDLFAAIDVKAFIQDRSLIVRKISIDNVYADINKVLAMFASEEEPSVEQTDEPFSLPLGLMEISSVSVNNLHVVYGEHAPGTLRAELQQLDLALNISTVENRAEGLITLDLPLADVAVGDTVFCAGLPVYADIPFKADLDSMKVRLHDAALTVAGQRLALAGTVAMPPADTASPIDMDLKIMLNQWNVAELMTLIPEPFQHLIEGISATGTITLDASARGRYSSEQMPIVSGTIVIDDATAQAGFLPVEVDAAQAELAFDADLGRNIANARIISFSVNSGEIAASVAGDVSNILDDPAFDLDMELRADLEELLESFGDMMPDSLNISAKGSARMDAEVSGRLSNITDGKYQKLTATADLGFEDLGVIYNDSIKVNSPEIAVALSLDSRRQDALGAAMTFPALDILMGESISGSAGNSDLRISMEDLPLGGTPLAVKCNFGIEAVKANMGSAIAFGTDSLLLGLSVVRDTDASNMLAQWSPELDLGLKKAVINMSSVEDAIKIPSIRLAFGNDSIQLHESSIALGNSDFNLSGVIPRISEYLEDKGLLTAELDFVSSNADIDQLLAYVSGFGSEDADTTGVADEEIAMAEDSVAEEGNPFMVPLGVDVTLNTKIDQALAFGNIINNVGGKVTIKDGVAIIRQLGFTSDAAKMQLTAMYKSPRKNHLFAGLDFHLTDIEIDKLIQMVPQVDSIMPMLKSFAGQGEFHLSVETNLNSKYELKKSTLLGAATIEGKNLVVLDSETFDQIASLLMFKKSQKNMIDSLMVDVTVFRNEVDIYPFLLSIDNYKLILSGRHNLDMSFNYHLDCLSPVRLGVDVKGRLGDLKIGLSPTRYKDLFVPERRNDIQERTIKLMELINSSLKEGVK